MIRVFVGYDSRQPVAYNVLQHSLHRHSKQRIQVEPLMLDKLPIKRRGLTEFTYSRFLVPWLCDYEGLAIFMDPDIAVQGDIAYLAAETDGSSAVQVMQDQPKFEWSSVMLFDCAKCKILTPEFVDDPANNLFDLSWGAVGTFPHKWNNCVGIAEPQAANLYHFTQGLPLWNETQGRPEDAAWLEELKAANHTVSWFELMGKSVHAKPVMQRFLKRYGINV